MSNPDTVYPAPNATTLDGSHNPIKYLDVSGIPLNFTILDFDQHMFLDLSGVIYKSAYDPSFAAYDAISEVDVSLATFREIFAIESDSDSLMDLSYNTVLDNVHFLVYHDKIDDFIPHIGSKSEVVAGTVQEKNSLGVSVNQHTKSDFVRYLAYLLFNTPYASELFINEQELVESTSRALDLAWDECKAKLRYVATDASFNHNMNHDTSGNYWYLDDSVLSDASGNGISNICGELYKQIVSNDPQRFNETNTLEVANDNVNRLGGKQYYLPFILNDIITIRITLNAAPTQDLFNLTVAERSGAFKNGTGPELKPKVYLIKMKLVA
jgi:hypothetical protein